MVRGRPETHVTVVRHRAVHATTQGFRIMAKSNTLKIRMNSTADTGFFYVTKKNPKTTTEKLVMKKYDPIARKHVEFKEGKIK